MGALTVPRVGMSARLNDNVSLRLILGGGVSSIQPSGGRCADICWQLLMKSLSDFPGAARGRVDLLLFVDLLLVVLSFDLVLFRSIVALAAPFLSVAIDTFLLEVVFLGAWRVSEWTRS